MRPLSSTRKIVSIGVFSAVAFVLQMIGSAVGLKVGGFLEIEISDLPALIIAMAYGPWMGILVELIKNLLHCMVTTTGFVGEFANFVVNGSFCLIAGLIYNRKKTFRTGVVALGSGVIGMVLFGIISNLFIMLPMYRPTASMQERLVLVLGTIVPFNLVRGLVLAVLTIILYKKISRFLKRA